MHYTNPFCKIYVRYVQYSGTACTVPPPVVLIPGFHFSLSPKKKGFGCACVPYLFGLNPPLSYFLSCVVAQGRLSIPCWIISAIHPYSTCDCDFITIHLIRNPAAISMFFHPFPTYRFVYFSFILVGVYRLGLYLTHACCLAVFPLSHVLT